MLLSQECHAICHVTSLVSCVVTWTRNTWYDTLLTAVTLVKTCNNIVTFNPLLWQQITMHSYTSDRPTDAIKSTFTLFLKTILYMSSNKSVTKSVQSCWRPRHTHTHSAKIFSTVRTKISSVNTINNMSDTPRNSPGLAGLVGS